MKYVVLIAVGPPTAEVSPNVQDEHNPYAQR